jgi:hypothetical protein
MAGGSWLDALLGKIASDGTYLDLGAGINFGPGLSAALNTSTKLVDVDVADDSVAPLALAPEAGGIATTFAIHKTFAALTTGTADDVTIYAANAPFAFRILRVELIVSAAVGGSVLRLRSATANGGSALSSQFAGDTVTDNPDRSIALSAFPNVAAGGTLVLRRSDRAVAGSIAMICERV